MPRPTVIVPGYFAQASEYSTLENFLKEQGLPTITVPLSKWDWLPTVGGRSMLPILRKIDSTVEQLLQEYPESLLNIIGHSAGGWITRIYLGDQPYDVHGEKLEVIWSKNKQIHSLITLGTPHRSGEYWTKKNLNFVNDNYPGAYYRDINYICIAGKLIYGKPDLSNWLAYNSYKLTLGSGLTWGDGITPIESAHLEGANNITLEGVGHAPNNKYPWYGSIEVAQQWLQYL